MLEPGQPSDHARPGVLLHTMIVAFAALLACLPGLLMDRPLETHEVFVAQTSREMLAAGSWATPEFNGQPRLNKPPLMYWLVMAASRTLPGAESIAPWVARLPSVGATVLLALSTLLLGSTLYDRRTALWGSLLALGSLGLVRYATNARPEMLYAGLSVAMVACLCRGADVTRRNVLWCLAGWAFGGLAILAKGPQIPLLLLGGLLGHALVVRGWRETLRAFRPAIGLPILLGVPLPWVIALLSATPEGSQAWVRDLFAGREVDEARGVMNFLDPFYLYAVPGLIVPSVVFLPVGIASAFVPGRPDLARGKALLVVLVVTILVMGLSNHRRDYYMLALVPFMTLLTARGVIDLVETRLRTSWHLPALRSLAAAAVVCDIALPALSGTAWFWGTKRYRDWAFAKSVAETTGSPADRVFALGTDAARSVYARNRSVPVLRAFAEVQTQLAAAPARVFLITTIDRFEAQTEVRGQILHRADVHPGDNRDVLILLTRD